MDESTSKSDKRNRKRRRNTAADQAAAKVGAILSEEELLKFDSSEMESYIKHVSSSRHLTAGEEKELKRVRRYSNSAYCCQRRQVDQEQRVRPIQ
jgi:hypothetical protein